MRFLSRLTVTFLIFAGTTFAQSGWVEETSGDLSGDPASPTSVALALGENTISGSVVSPGDVRDYLTFSIPAGQQLVAIQLVNYVDLDNGSEGNTGFHSLNVGSTSFIPGGGTAGSFLGGDHLTVVPGGTNLLAVLGEAPLAGTGFDLPLGEGDYTYLVQQTGPQNTGYEVSFTLAAIPEPSASLLSLFAMVGVLTIRRSRKP